MKNTLQNLSQFTTIVADTGDIEAIKKYQPKDATTNPSLIFKAAQIPEYAPLIEDAIAYAKTQSDIKSQQIEDACDMLAINIGREILKAISGRISIEVDAKLSYDTIKSIEKARKIITLFHQMEIPKDRILIKLAATWEGIRAAEILEKEGINCNLTLLFSFAQARACAEAGVYLISPFVGRIMDWYKAKEQRDFQAEEDPGVLSVGKIYHYYKDHAYKTIVMGASFRNTGEILALAGCDRLTISPALLAELEANKEVVIPRLIDAKNSFSRPALISHAEFLWQHNQDPMAVEKLAEGIRLFAADQTKLEELLASRLTKID